MNIVVEDVKNRINYYNKNWLCCICGETGSGKSYTAMKIAESIDPNFNINRVVFTAEKFMALLNSEQLKKGDVIIWDELQVSHDARTFMSLQNRLINYVLQSFRHLNLGVIFTSPDLSMIDVNIRRLLHVLVETSGSINLEKQACIVKWLNVKNNPRMNKIYYIYPRITKDGMIKEVRKMEIYLPSQRLIEQYEKKKLEFSKTLRKGVEEEIQGIKEKAKRKLTDEQIIEVGNEEGIDWNNTGKVVARFNIYREKAYRLQAKVRERS